IGSTASKSSTTGSRSSSRRCRAAWSSMGSTTPASRRTTAPRRSRPPRSASAYSSGSMTGPAARSGGSVPPPRSHNLCLPPGRAGSLSRFQPFDSLHERTSHAEQRSRSRRGARDFRMQQRRSRGAFQARRAGEAEDDAGRKARRSSQASAGAGDRPDADQGGRLEDQVPVRIVRALRLRRRRVAGVLLYERHGGADGQGSRGRRVRGGRHGVVHRREGRERQVQAEGGRRAGRRGDAAQERGREGLLVHDGDQGGRPEDRDGVHERPLQGRRVRPQLLPQWIEAHPYPLTSNPEPKGPPPLLPPGEAGRGNLSGSWDQNSFFFINFSISSTSRGAPAERRSKPSFVIR